MHTYVLYVYVLIMLKNHSLMRCMFYSMLYIIYASQTAVVFIMCREGVRRCGWEAAGQKIEKSSVALSRGQDDNEARFIFRHAHTNWWRCEMCIGAFCAPALGPRLALGNLGKPVSQGNIDFPGHTDFPGNQDSQGNLDFL